MDAAQFGEYLHLIGFKPTRCDLTALKILLTRHMAALPFQTLSTVLGEPVPIDSGSIFRKLVAQRRGGYCYELNLLLLDALTLLGFEARPLTGSVIPNNRLEEAGARTHMLLQVTLQGQPWLVDAGFGGLAPTAPLLLESEKTQLTPHGQYRLKPHGTAWFYALSPVPSSSCCTPLTASRSAALTFRWVTGSCPLTRTRRSAPASWRPAPSRTAAATRC